MGSEPTLVVVDSTFVKYFAAERQQSRLERLGRVAQLRVWPSTVNAVEALNHSDAQQRALRGRDRGLVRGSTRCCHVQPRCCAFGAIRARAARLAFHHTNLDAALRAHWDRAAAERQARELTEQSEATFRAVHDAARSAVQAEIKARGLRGRWPTCRAFLEEESGKPGMFEHFAGLLWAHFRLPGDAPLAALAKLEA